MHARPNDAFVLQLRDDTDVVILERIPEVAELTADQAQPGERLRGDVAARFS